ncbi:MAG: hypothetical protein LC791_20410, partial [Acidobacteria bacterium]|nr:hypothetical protein [Acidobacteriota bacterium]
GIAAVWAVAFGGALMYGPLSPVWRPYLMHPLWLVWCCTVATLVGVILRSPGTPPAVRLAAIVVLLGASVDPYPTFCSIRYSVRAVATLRAGGDAALAPLGYTHGLLHVRLYEWEDYRATLDYIRTRTGAEIRVANLINGVAVTVPRHG